LLSCREIRRRYAGSDKYFAVWMVLRSMPHSLSAAAMVFCLDAADHLPTIGEPRPARISATRPSAADLASNR
jgi:hypothetical protein